MSHPPFAPPGPWLRRSHRPLSQAREQGMMRRQIFRCHRHATAGWTWAVCPCLLASFCVRYPLRRKTFHPFSLGITRWSGRGQRENIREKENAHKVTFSHLVGVWLFHKSQPRQRPIECLGKTAQGYIPTAVCCAGVHVQLVAQLIDGTFDLVDVAVLQRQPFLIVQNR